MAEVLTYIRQSRGNNASPISADYVQKLYSEQPFRADFWSWKELENFRPTRATRQPKIDLSSETASGQTMECLPRAREASEHAAPRPTISTVQRTMLDLRRHLMFMPNRCAPIAYRMPSRHSAFGDAAARDLAGAVVNINLAATPAKTASHVINRILLSVLPLGTYNWNSHAPRNRDRGR